MFEDPGQKLKSFAKAAFWLTLIGSVILAFVFGIDRSGWRNEINALLFLFPLCGSFTAYFEGLVLYAFGELVENSYDTRRAAERLFELYQKRG